MGKPSLYPDEWQGCFLCGTTSQLEHHHIYPTSRRDASEREGCTVWLCHEHHQGRFGAHGKDRSFDRWLRADCQRRWEQREGIDDPEHEAFRSVFHDSYL